MDFRLLVFSRTHFSPSSLELLFSPRLAEHRARSGRRRRPEGKQPFFSTPSSIYIERLKASPCQPSRTPLPPVSFLLSSYLFVVRQEPSSSVHLFLFLHLLLFLFRFCFLLSFTRLFCFVSRIHALVTLAFATFKYSFCGRIGTWVLVVDIAFAEGTWTISAFCLYLSISSFLFPFSVFLFDSYLVSLYLLPMFLLRYPLSSPCGPLRLSFCENVPFYRADVICTTQRELVNILEVG